VLDALREPLVDRQVAIRRVHAGLTFPADFQLLLAANPCPCGFQGDAATPCVCPPREVQRYRGRLSGPLLDRVDLHVRVPRRPLDLAGDPVDPAPLRQRVRAARARQAERWGPGGLNARTPLPRLLAASPPELRAALASAGSPRAQAKLLALAWTLADLDGEFPARSHLDRARGLRFSEARGAAA